MSLSRPRKRSRAHSSEHEGGGSERWLVSYADFITLLFAFFVVMFAISQADLKKFKEVSESVRRAFSGQSADPNPQIRDPFDSTLQAPPQSSERLVVPNSKLPLNATQDAAADREILQIKKLLEEALEVEEDLAVRNEVEMKGSSDHPALRWVIQDSYPERQIEVAQDYLPLLGRVARVLERFRDRPIRLEGHADRQEAAQNGMQGGLRLGFERASWIARFFMDHGVGDQMITVASRGASSPLRAMGSQQRADVNRWTRARNRRVELWILPRGP